MLRENQPEQGKWWFPGGRIHFGESRLDAARRKVKEECGLDVSDLIGRPQHLTYFLELPT